MQNKLNLEKFWIELQKEKMKELWDNKEMKRGKMFNSGNVVLAKIQFTDSFEIKKFEKLIP